MKAQIKQLLVENPEAKGKTILYYGYAFGDDRAWVPYAMQQGLHTEIRDVSNIAVANAENYADVMVQHASSDYVPSVFLDDISYFKYLEQSHVQMVYVCRVLGLVSHPYELLYDIGKGLFTSKEQPGRLVVIQSFDDCNQSDDHFTMALLNKAQFLASLEQGAGQKLTVVNEKIIGYYHKKVTALTVKTTRGD